MGLEFDLIILTNCICDGKLIHSGKIVSSIIFHSLRFDDIVVNKAINDLSFVTDFSLRHAKSVHSGHLEQLAIACPNLQRLSLEGNSECLSNLQGLRAIAYHCHSLVGLNLKSINVDSHLQLWRILSDMELSHLVLDICAMMNGEAHEQQLCALYQKCSKLQAIELWLECLDSFEAKWSLLSHFPVLLYISVFYTEDPNTMADIISSCNQLLCVSCKTKFGKPLNLSLSVSCCKLQDLCIDSDRTEISHHFMEAISAHGGLMRVVLYVKSITAEGITSLVANSKALLMLMIFTPLTIRTESGSKISLNSIKHGLKKRFPNRILFSVGNYRVEHNCKFLFLRRILSESAADFGLYTLWPSYL